MEVELRQTLSLLGFSFNKRTAASAQLEGGEGGGGVLFYFFFATKLEFSVPPVSGNGSSSTMQTVLGVVTSMDLLTFVSSNGKK